MGHSVTNQQTDSGCKPDQPAPTPQQDGECIGTLEGTITGTIRMEGDCGCCKLVSQTFAILTGPLTEQELADYIQTTANDYEAQGYIILGHSMCDIGAGWIFNLSIGWMTSP